MPISIKPINDRIFVERVEAASEVGGIHIPDSARPAPQEGVVRFAGPGPVIKDGTRRPLDVKIGDRVLFAKYGGSDLSIDGQKLVILTEGEIYAVLEPEFHQTLVDLIADPKPL